MFRKEIEKQDWQERLQSFTSGNYGRSSEVITRQGKLAHERSFQSVDFDPEGVGNIIMISLDGFGHQVENPDEMFIEELDNGEVSLLEIVDQNGDSTFMSFLG